MQGIRNYLQTVLQRFTAKIRDVLEWCVQVRVRIVLKITNLRYACGYGARLPQTDLVSFPRKVSELEIWRFERLVNARL